MYIGHFAPALAASAISSEAPRLGTLFVAAQLVDLVFFAFVITGVEHMRVVPGLTAMNPMDLYHMPYTHSLVATALWGLVTAGFLWHRRGSRSAGAWAAMVVLSHWLLDLVVHRPDLTIAGSPPKLGLGLWNTPAVAIPLELSLIALAFGFYLRRTRGPIGPPMILLGVMLLFQAVNWFGPQPTEMNLVLPLSALLSYALLIGVASWVGTTRHHRRAAGLAISPVRR